MTTDQVLRERVHKPVFYPEIKPWTCAGCRRIQEPTAKKYGHIYCRICAHSMCMKSYGEN